MQRFARFLRAERGEMGIIPVIAGSILFLFSAAAVAGTLTVFLAAGTLAQSNTELTTALQNQIHKFESTAWGNLTTVGSPTNPVTVDLTLCQIGKGTGMTEPTNTTCPANPVTYPVTRTITFDPVTQSYLLRITAPRAQGPGINRISCVDALTVKKTGCVTLSGNVVATPADIAPVTPAGVTLNTLLIPGGTGLTNLISDPGFENGTLTNWASTPTGAATNSAGSTPSGGGSRVMLLTQQAAPASVTYTQVASTGFGDQWKLEAWVNPQGSDGSIVLSATVNDSTGVTTIPLATTNSTTTGWQLLSGLVTMPPTTTTVTLSLSLSGGTSSTNVWTVDNVALSLTSANFLPQGDFENSTWPVTPSTGGAIVTTTNRLAPGTKALQLNADSSTVEATSSSTTITQLDKTYVVEAWVKAVGTASSTGQLELHAYSSALGTNYPLIASQPLNSFGSNWVHVVGSYTSTTANGVFGLKLDMVGAASATGIIIDDITVRLAQDTFGATSSNFLQLATLDPAVVGTSNDLRVSFKYLSSATPPALTMGVYCGSEATNNAIVQNVATQTTSADGTWYWSRITLPALDRLSNCATPSIRTYATTGATPGVADIGQLTILRVLNGVAGTVAG